MTEIRKEIVLKIPDPQKAEQVRELLETLRFCRLWIPGFAEISKPLYETTKGSQDFIWTEERGNTVATLKCKLLEILVQGLPDVNKHFILFVAKAGE